MKIKLEQKNNQAMHELKKKEIEINRIKDNVRCMINKDEETNIERSG
jgi:hypothetical protein